VNGARLEDNVIAIALGASLLVAVEITLNSGDGRFKDEATSGDVSAVNGTLHSASMVKAVLKGALSALAGLKDGLEGLALNVNSINEEGLGLLLNGSNKLETIAEARRVINRGNRDGDSVLLVGDGTFLITDLVGDLAVVGTHATVGVVGIRARTEANEGQERSRGIASNDRLGLEANITLEISLNAGVVVTVNGSDEDIEVVLLNIATTNKEVDESGIPRVASTEVLKELALVAILPAARVVGSGPGVGVSSVGVEVDEGNVIDGTDINGDLSDIGAELLSGVGLENTVVNAGEDEEIRGLAHVAMGINVGSRPEDDTVRGISNLDVHAVDGGTNRHGVLTAGEDLRAVLVEDTSAVGHVLVTSSIHLVEAHDDVGINVVVVAVEVGEGNDKGLVLLARRGNDLGNRGIIAVGDVNGDSDVVRFNATVSDDEDKEVELRAIASHWSLVDNAVKRVRDEAREGVNGVAGLDNETALRISLVDDHDGLEEEALSGELNDATTGLNEVAEGATLELNDLNVTLNTRGASRHGDGNRAIGLDVLNLGSTEGGHVEDGLINVRLALLTVHGDGEASEEVVVEAVHVEDLSIGIPHVHVEVTSVGEIVEGGSVARGELKSTNGGSNKVSRGTTERDDEAEAKVIHKGLILSTDVVSDSENGDDVTAHESITDSLSGASSSNERLGRGDHEELASTVTPANGVNIGIRDLSNGSKDVMGASGINGGLLSVMGDPVEVARVREDLDDGVLKAVRSKVRVGGKANVGVGSKDLQEISELSKESILVLLVKFEDGGKIPLNLLRSANANVNLKREVNIASR